MATKEAMVSAPLLVLFFDRTLVDDDFLSCWKKRRAFYLFLFGSWLLLAWLIVASGGRYGTGLSEVVVSPWEYLLTQCRAIVTYLRLSFWPSPLIFDYGMAVVRDLPSVWPQGVFLSALAAVTAWSAWRRYPAGLLGVWFFFTLAPSSSVVPLVTQTMAEHRMYLPLAAVVVALVVLVARSMGYRGLVALAIVLPVLSVATICRNEKYHSALALWQDTIEKKPINPRVQKTMGDLMMEADRAKDALACYKKEDEFLGSKDPSVYIDIAAALRKLNDLDGAEEALQKVLNVKPVSPFALCESGRLFIARGRWDEAEKAFSQALEVDPAMPEALINLGVIAARNDQAEKALEYYRAAVRFNPNDPVATINLGNTLLRLNRFAEAEAVYRQAIKSWPKSAAAWYGLGCVCVEPARWSVAVGYFERALEIDPKFADAHNNLAGILLNLNRRGEAVAHYEAAVRINPKFGKAQATLATLYAQDGRLNEACERYQLALVLMPDDYEAHGNLGLVYQLLGDAKNAEYHYREALRIFPNYGQAQERLNAIAGKQ
jgi:tetratricopeptide (TPR) repeat protein